jgi:hypothetical protein
VRIVQSVAKPHRFSASDWRRMGEVGLLESDPRAELTEGEVIDMAPIGSAHAALATRFAHLMVSRLAGRALVSVQNPLQLGDFSEPRPDLMLLRRREDFYARATAGGVLLVAEAADTTLAYDRDRKVALYGRYGVSRSWLVNLPERIVEVDANPSSQGYPDRHIARVGEALEPLPGLSADLGLLFGG